jgi:hypothetical protein
MHGRGYSSYTSVDDGLSDDERRTADEYAKTGKIPRMATAGREPFDSSWKSWGLSGKAGYLRYRKIYGGWDSELISSLPADQSNESLLASTSSGTERGGATG